MFEPITIPEFLERTGINASEIEHPFGSARQVISLRDLCTIEGVQVMSRDYLHKMLSHATVMGGNRERVYMECRIHLMSVSPLAVRIGQRFIERRKYTALLEDFSSKLEGYLPGGLMITSGLIVLGRTKSGEQAIAQYVPPIAEMNGDSKWTLLDGVHRNYLIQRIGGVTPIIAIEGVRVPFPCTLHDWQAIRPVDEKPPVEERYFDLKPELFRDLKYVGIDG